MSIERRKNGDVLVELIPLAGRAVVDVGCGDGALVRLMARQGARAVGIDCNPKQLDKAKAEPPVAGESYVEGVGEALPLKDRSMDAVVFFNALHHVPVQSQAAALKEAQRVLRPSGLVYVAEPVAEGPNFELVRLVDDETEVRARAYAAIKDSGRLGLRQEREFAYIHAMVFKDFAAFRERHIRIDPRRAPIVERREPELRARFDRLGVPTPEGFAFDQPIRVNLLRKP